MTPGNPPDLYLQLVWGKWGGKILPTLLHAFTSIHPRCPYLSAHHIPYVTHGYTVIWKEKCPSAFPSNQSLAAISKKSATEEEIVNMRHSNTCTYDIFRERFYMILIIDVEVTLSLCLFLYSIHGKTTQVHCDEILNENSFVYTKKNSVTELKLYYTNG